MTHLSVRLAEKRPQDGGGPEAEDYLPYLPQAFTRNDTRGHVPTVGALDSSTKSEQARQRGGLLVSSNFDGCTKAGLQFLCQISEQPIGGSHGCSRSTAFYCSRNLGNYPLRFLMIPNRLVAVCGRDRIVCNHLRQRAAADKDCECCRAGAGLHKLRRLQDGRQW